MNFDQLYKIIENRKKNMPSGSYVASLLRSGDDRIIQKVGEEAVEVLIAAKNENKKQIIYEVADLVFHTLVLLAYFEIPPKEIITELSERNKRTRKRSS